MQCADCHFTDPSDYSDVTSGDCPMCGSNSYQDQPNPINSEMGQRDMPAPGEEDQGGNPLREGILADNGWQPYGTSQGTGRDESYASVQATYQDRFNPSMFPDRDGFDQCPRCKGLVGSHDTLLTDKGCSGCGFAYRRDSPRPGPNQQIFPQVVAPPKHPETGEPLTSPNYVPIAPNEVMQMTPRQGAPSLMNPIQQNVIDRQDSVIPWHMAADFDIEQVIEPGPHTVEVSAPGQPLILQHDDPAVLDAAKRQMTAGLLGDLAQGAGMAGAIALAPETGGASLAAEEGLAGAAGGGLARGMLGRAAGGLMKAITPGNVGRQIGNGALRQIGEQAVGMGGQPQGGGAGSTPEQFRGLDQLSHIVGAFGDDSSSPTSQDHIPSNDTEDPEQVDPKEKNDGDNKDWEKDFSVNGDGGTASPEHPFDENGGGMEALELLLPLVLQHHQNGTGHDDPLIQALDQILEGEAPGYKDSDPDHEAIEIVMGGGKPKEEDSDSDEKTLPGAEDEKDDPLVDDEPKKESRVASGPRTPEQFKAVADLLRTQGRDSELQNLIDMPDQYEKELAEVQQRQDITPAETPAAPMPPQPAQEETPPGAGMPMPAPPTGIQPMGAVHTHCPPCPNCTSHTTGFIDNEGHASCKTCHHHWKEGDLLASDGDSSHNTTTSSDHHHDPVDPAADQHQRGDLAEQQDTGLTWQDESGQPLQVGQQYDMYSARYEIPDEIRITAIKPEAIEYELTSEYGIDHSTQITKQDADLYRYTFVPAGLDDAPINATNDPGVEENNAYAGQADPGQVSDVSHQAAVDPNLAWLMDGAPNTREAGANFTLREQRGFIDEYGTARNADKLDLSGTHYTSDFGSGASDDDFLFGP